MENRFFSTADLAVLLAPSRWRLVAANLADPAPLRCDGRGRAWRLVGTHAHPHREILVALQGRGTYGIGGRVYACVPGSVFSFAPGVPHDGGYPSHGDGLQHLWITTIGGGVIARALAVEAGEVWHGVLNHSFEQQRLGFDAQRLLNEAESAIGLSCDAGRTTLIGAIAAICVRLAQIGFESGPEASRNDQRAQTIASVRRHIADRAGRNIALADLAHIAGCSVFHFCRLFKQHTGTTVHRLIDECRWREVRRQRAEGRIWRDIGADLGFGDATAFSRWLRLQRQRGFGGE